MSNAVTISGSTYTVTGTVKNKKLVFDTLAFNHAKNYDAFFETFNPDLLSPVDKEAYLQELTRGGLGVHLIKKIMDEVEYTVSPGVSNCLKMVKFTKEK